MNKPTPHSEHPVLSRGQWDKGASKADIESATLQFRDWLARNIGHGRTKSGIVTDGPFSEAKEFIGGHISGRKKPMGQV